jgi:hypothetical protein
LLGKSVLWCGLLDVFQVLQLPLLYRRDAHLIALSGRFDDPFQQDALGGAALRLLLIVVLPLY